ncbi:MAG TPA: AtpZ/AtpI family protein [Candidatus Acidoferrales bacterium]|nr:AtpZ/AtpI family protein [Candidatus Acidoferrales bacterium]
MSSTGNATPPQGPSPAGPIRGFTQQLAVATELPFVLVASVVVGGLIGAGVDRLLHTGPFGLLVFGILGFVAGVREVLRRLGKSGDGGGGSSSK